MQKFYGVAILLAGGLLLFCSCKKKDKANTCAITEANFSGSYKVESVKYKASATTPEVDGTTLFFESCELDDVTTFNTDHTYVYSDAGTACDPKGDDNGTWSLSGTNLTVDGASTAVENFSCSNFSLTQNNINTTGDKVTITFKKQ